MPYDQLRFVSINRTSGVYQIRLNFDGNVKYTTTGSHFDLRADSCLIGGLKTFTSSRASEELENLLGNCKLEFSDDPVTTGNIIRECFEQARVDKYFVHCVIARYSNDIIPVFQEFIFAGSFDPREMTIGHRFVPKVGRRTETISCEFSPAKRLDVPLSEIDWQESDMELVRPFFLCIENEPGHDFWLKRNRFMPTKLTDLIFNGKSDIQGNFSAGALTGECAYGIQPFSLNKEVDKLRDEPGTGPFPIGNWAIKLSTVIEKLFTACNIIWDGNFPAGLNFRFAHLDQTAKIYEDDGELDPSYVILNWNYAFGFNPYDGSNFKGPATWDFEKFCREALKGIAVQLKSRIDIYGYDSDGLPLARFVPFGYTAGALPTLERKDESSEDAFVTDKDGVRLVRRGYDGGVIAPAESTNPATIEVPFAPFAIGYETSPCYDVTRLQPNASLDFIDQWKCGFRGALQDGGEDETTYPLNPDGWCIGAHLFRYDSSTDINQFPTSHDSPDGLYGDFESAYRPTKWQGYYPVHAIYDVDRGELIDDQIKERQKNFLISYALYYGRYLRGERRRLVVSFKDVIAPMWSDIAIGMTYNFQPLTTDVEYTVVEIERNVEDGDEGGCIIHFEESSPATLPLSYRIDGDQKGSGSIGGGGSTDNATGTPPSTDENIHDVKFYSGGVLQKTISMSIRQFYDGVNDRKVALQGTPYPFDETGGEDYGQNAQFFFHYKGTESGNVEIVGLSPAGTADYWASFVTQYKHGSNPTDDTDVTYRLLNGRWSDDRNAFIIERPLQAAAVKPRIYVAGRVLIDYARGLGTWTLSFQSIGSAAWPLSAVDCQYNIDKGYLGGSSVAAGSTTTAPGLALVGNNLEITWGTKYKPVTIMSQAWAFNPLDTNGPLGAGHDWQIGANPCINQQPNANSVQIGFWLNNFAGAVGQRHITKESLANIFAQAALDQIYVDFWGELEIVGENA